MNKRLLTFLILLLWTSTYFSQVCDGYIKSQDSLFITKTFAINGSSDVIAFGIIQAGNKSFISRLDQNGNFLWVKTLDYTAMTSNHLYCDGSFIFQIVDTSSNGIEDAHLKKYNLSGSQIVEQALPVNVNFYDLDLDGNGNIVLLGQAVNTVVAGTYTLSPNTQTASNIYEQEVIIKLNSSLNVVWAKFGYQCSTFVSFPNFGYSYIQIDKSTNEIYYLISAFGVSNYTVNFGSSIVLTGPGNNNLLAKFNSGGTCLWANFGTFTPPVSDGWVIQNGQVLVAGPPLSVSPANLDIFSATTGSLLASYSKTISSSSFNYFPIFLFSNNAIYCVGSEFIYSRHFIEKYDYNLNLITRRYFGNSIGSTNQIFAGASLVNNYIYFSSSLLKGEFIGPGFFHIQIPVNDSLCFYGKLGLELNLLKGNFIAGSTTLLCGQSQQINLASNFNSPFDQNLIGLNINWSPSVGLSASNSFSVTLSPSNNTQYIATISDASCTVSDTANILVEQISAFNYTINNMVVNFSKQGNNCNSFIWDFGNGNTSSLNSDPVVTYATPGIYGVCLQCNGLNACTKCLNITVPGTGSGGVNITEVETDEVINVYPNPSNGKFYLLSISGQTFNHECKITDVFGNVIFHEKILGDLHTLDLSNNSKGIYILQLTNQNSKTKLFKLIFN